MSNVIDIILKITKMGKGDVETQEGLKTLTGVLGKLGIGLSAVGIASAGLNQLEKAITNTVAYNKEIREMSQYIGLSADETSRLIQVTDDWGISAEDARSALEMMNKKGITPSIDALAKIADDFVNSKDKAAFAEEANKKYGRSFSDLIPILAGGGQALRDQAAAVNENLIVTDEAIAESRDFEVALDDLGDAAIGVRNKVGNTLIPIVTDLMTTLNDAGEASEDFTNVEEDYKIAVDAGVISTQQQSDMLIAMYQDGVDPVATSLQIMTAQLNAAAAATNVNAASTAGETALLAAHQAAWDDAATAVGNYSDATNNAAMAIMDLDKKQMGQKAVEALNKAFEDGTLSEEDYRSKMVEVMDHMLSMDDKSMITTLKMADLNKQLADGTIDAGEYADRVATLYGNLTRLDGTEASTYINEYHATYYEEIYGTDYGGGGGGRHAAGLDMMVPTGYSGDRFPLGALGFAESGERIIIIPKNEVPGAGGNPNTNNYYLTAHYAYQPQESLASTIKTLAMLNGAG